MEQDIENDRLKHIDVAKGIGIICVVVAHIIDNQAPARDIIYLFHMPLFFYISGYLFKPELNQKRFIKDKTKQYLIPYFTYLIIIITFQITIRDIGATSLGPKELAVLLFKAILGGRWLNGLATVFWFVTTLYLTIIAFNFLYFSIKSRKFLHLLMGILLTISYFNAMLFPALKIPWDANVIFAAMPIFYAGHLFRSVSHFNHKVVLTFSALIAFVSITQTSTGSFHNFDMKVSKYGTPLIGYIVSISWTWLILLICRYISKYFNRFSSILKKIGKASLVIMYTHQPIQILFKSTISTDNFIIIIASIIIPLLLYNIFQLQTLTRALFIGTKTDIEKLVAKRDIVQHTIR